MILAWLLLLVAGGPAPADSALTERMLVQRVRWPVRLTPTAPGGCDDLAPADVLLSEGGRRMRVDAVEPSRLPSVHALVIDVSYSMLPRLDRARRAAAGYLRSLPPDEPAMVASFSENLVLHQPMTRSRERLEAALDRIEVRRNTAWFDALHVVTAGLAEHRERKVVVAITDGCDGMSVPGRGLPETVEQARSIPDLSIFTIGIDLPRSCRSFSVSSGPATTPADDLASLAHRTGGEFFPVRSMAALPGVFAEIRGMLEREGFVTYAADPRVSGRRVRVRAAEGVRCRVDSAVAGRRVAHPAGDALEIPGGRLALDGNGDSWIEPDDGGYRLRIPDVVGERSQLYYPPALERRGRYRIVVDGRREREPRTVRLQPPPFAGLVRGSDPRGELLWRLLERGEPPFRAERTAERAERFRARLTPGWMHGQAWLEWRDVIAAALGRHAGYRPFAHDLLAGEDRRSKEALVAEALRLGEIDASQAAGLRTALAGLTFEPARRGVTARLGAWLGDVGAREWTAELERWLANRLLAGEPEVDAQIERLEARWSELAGWFPPPTTVRVLTPLVPALDETREAVGFYRVLLPTVEDRGPPRDAVPSAPFGLREVRRLAGEGAIDPGERIEAIRYRTLQGAEARRARRASGAGRDRRVVRVALGLLAADGSRREHETVRIDGAR